MTIAARPGSAGGAGAIGAMAGLRRRSRLDLLGADAERGSLLLRHLVEAAEAAPRFQATGEVVRVIGTTV